MKQGTILSDYFPYRHPDVENNLPQETMVELFDILTDGHASLIFHNRKFDLHSITTLGSWARDRILNDSVVQYDTMMLAHMMNEELPSKELDWLSKVFLNDQKDEDLKNFASAFGWGNVPSHLMYRYACHDTELTYRLFDIFWPRVVEQDMDHLWEIEQQFTTMLYRMEREGVLIDKETTQKFLNQGLERMEIIEAELGFKPSSPISLGAYLLDELGLPVLSTSTKTGKPSFAKDTMADYEDILSAKDDPSATLILEYRGWQKATSSLYLPLLERVSPDGRIRTTYKQQGTVTSRLSSAKPNLQQVPRASEKPWNGKAKTCFKAPEGFVLMGYDYSQLEFRLAAAYGQEQYLIDEFAKDGADPFKPMTERVYGEFTQEGRYKIKTKTYATIYGAGMAKVAAQLGMTEEEIGPQYARFKASIPGIISLSNQVSALVAERGFVKYWTGRRRHIKDKKTSYKAFNSLLQGGGAEVVKRAMISCRELECDDLKIVMQVHDEIVFCIREGCVEKFEPEIIKRMTNFPEFPVRFAVEGKVWNK
jgi:DNA polymerase-1